MKAQLDGAFNSKVAAETARRNAEADREAKAREALLNAAQFLEQVVRPGLDVLCAYLKGRNIDAVVQTQQVNGQTAVLELVWGRNVQQRSSYSRTTHAQQNTFKVNMKPDGGLLATSALLGEDFVPHVPMPDPLTTDWVQIEAGKVIARSISA